MNPPQRELVPMTTISQPCEETQELIRLFRQIKKSLLILGYKDVTDESVKPVLNTYAGNEPNRETPSFSINDAKDVKSYLISVSTYFQNPKYYNNTNKPVIWLRKFMKEHSADYVKDSYIEGIQFTQDEATDMPLKHRLRFLKLRVVTQAQI